METSDIIVKVMEVPGVRISRSEYLKEVFSKYYDINTVNNIINTSPVSSGVSANRIEELVEQAISEEKHMTALISFGTGLVNVGGALTAIGVGSADLIQYFTMCLRLAQKMAYLYGWSDLSIANNSSARDTLTVFLGCMMGVEAATKAITELGEAIAKDMLKKTIQQRILEGIGVVVSRDLTKRALSKAIPLIGGVISGSLTWIIFQKNADNLRKALKTERLKISHSNNM